MAIDRTTKHVRIAAMAIGVALNAWSLPAVAGSTDTFGFCPRGYDLWGALCMHPSTGDVEKPATRGPAYEARKSETPGLAFCAAWDTHITTQIADFGTVETLSSDRLGKAGLLQVVARTLCGENRFAEGIAVYEAIFADLE